MPHRVACLSCGAHRNGAQSASCGVCGATRSRTVTPSLADVDAAIADTAAVLAFLTAVRLQLDRTTRAAPHAEAFQ